ncbi:SDR family NAD(P)-dependent oxidoreductase [Specibacter cremeus]|uniref:SDR family NAD(P)-dependent oxidoreductase n=1 Tax=Specibacter cremeus TaxID=1629051 RepID=UPI000F7AFCA6|nr:SDR family NAD(P)-dependent oxidoreductase [Specibacter cremeus]
MEPDSVQPLVLIAGGSSAAGVAVSRALVTAGLRVVTVGSDDTRIRVAAQAAGGAVPAVADLADPAAVERLAAAVHRDHGPIDGLIHLVGGWRGGADLAAQSDADWDFLHRNVVTTLRNTTRTFYPDLVASARGRVAIVSSTSVTDPTPGNANYATAKAAAETWLGAVANGLAQPGDDGHPGRGAAVVLVVKALVDDAMRAAAPERKFPGFTDVSVLGQTVVSLFSPDTDAHELNGRRMIL